MTHALVVGGTGMLRGVTEHLLERFDAVSVVSRRRSVPGANPLLLDWANAEALRSALTGAARRHGHFDLAVCWIHSSAPEAPRIVAESVRPCTLYQIFGSGSDSGRPVQRRWVSEVSGVAGIDYRRVVLGRVGSRWLTDKEISAGVIDAVRAGRPFFVVGEVEGEPDGR